MPDPFLSEVKFLGAGNVDFIEIAVDAGMDVSGIQVVIYNPNGTVRTTNDLTTPDETVAGRDVYSIDSGSSATFNGIHKNGAVALVQDGEVLQFISFEQEVTADGGPADGETSTALGGTGQGESLESTDGGGSYSVQSTPSQGTIPCFLSGTSILTAVGNRPVQEIAVGDMVMTDGGPKAVIWVGSRQLNLQESSDPAKRPIRIPAHALGHAEPFSDTFVSPNHRVLIVGPHCEMLFGQAAVFVAAKFLVGHFGIGHCPVALPVQYHHILLEDHEVLTANGLQAESLYNGKLSTEAFAQDGEAGAVYPLAAFVPHEQSAHMVLRAHEAQLLMRQYAPRAVRLIAAG
ncbi:MAG: Hint domain-containing protein [Cognatishimia sp.]